jgi:hypothetical protein
MEPGELTVKNMKSVAEYNETTSHYELYSYLSQKIISGEIDNFGDVLEILYQLPLDKRIKWVYPRLFTLIRSVYWGFLKDLDKKRYPGLWETFVIEDSRFPGVGKLKRNSKILTLFCGMLDIHGYTAFCQKVGRNLSMLQLLDDCIQDDIHQIARENEVICQRSRGDEIVLLGAKASSVLFAVMGIVDYFGKRKVIEHDAFQNVRVGNKIMLPDMKISAGISGGQKYTPLVITSNGDLSGHLINAAARLQARANDLAPKDTKILLAGQVYAKLKKETKIDEKAEEKLTGIYFRSFGAVEFKGTRMTVIDVIVRKEEMYIKAMEKGFKDLLHALKKSQWENKIFEITVDLIKIAATNMDTFTISLTEGEIIRNRDLTSLCDRALEEFHNSNQFHNALESFESICKIVQYIPDFDHLLLEYLRKVAAGYRQFKAFYLEELETILEKRADYLLPIDIRDVYKKAEKEAAAFEKLRKLVMEHPKIGYRKAIWLRVVQDRKSDLSVSQH